MISGKMLDTGKIPVIGQVENSITEPLRPDAFDGVRSIIRIFPEFEEGLYRMDEHTYVDVIFFFHRSKGYHLHTKTYSGEVKGVFASRSPHRPSGIGTTTVYLEKREGSLLYVKGLDAIDGTPVLDLKPADRYFSPEEKKIINR